MLSVFIEIVHFSPADKEEILLELEQLLSSRYFRASRRYPAFLRFVVRHTLDGHVDVLKERTLGAEVFGRVPSFDASADSIVRVTAAEIRKRIAQYYQDEGREHRLQIELPCGSYAPHFRRLESTAARIEETPERFDSSPSQKLEASELVQVDQTAESLRSGAILSGRKKIAIAAAVLLFIAIAALVEFGHLSRLTERKDLLAPLWTSASEITLCVGSPQIAYVRNGAASSEAPVEFSQYTMNNTVLPFADSRTLSHFEIALDSHKKLNRTKLAKNATFDDLRAGPVILIAGLDNEWTMRLTSKFRFHFVGNEATGRIADGAESTLAGIADSKQEQRMSLSGASNNPSYRMTLSQDYAIIAVTQDDTLRQPLIVAAGIGPNGTKAAGEFLLNSDDLNTLARMAPANWGGKNVEAVLATQVIQGNSGPPRIVAAEFW